MIDPDTLRLVCIANGIEEEMARINDDLDSFFLDILSNADEQQIEELKIK